MDQHQLVAGAFVRHGNHDNSSTGRQREKLHFDRHRVDKLAQDLHLRVGTAGEENPVVLDPAGVGRRVPFATTFLVLPSSPIGQQHAGEKRFATNRDSSVDVDPRDLTYVPYDGGGPLTSALLGKKIDVGFSGVGEFEGQLASGELRLLAVSGEERLEGEGIDEAPTLTEAGIDLVFTNWRGVFAPPGISEERRDELIAMLEEMHGTPEWRQALEDNGWIDEFKTGDDFTAFLQEQDQRVATTLEELDLL